MLQLLTATESRREMIVLGCGAGAAVTRARLIVIAQTPAVSECMPAVVSRFLEDDGGFRRGCKWSFQLSNFSFFWSSRSRE